MSQYLKPNVEKLRKAIKHVVVLMLENRSFDNLLGWLYENEYPPRGQHFEGLHSWMWNPLNNIDTDGVPFVEKVYIRKNGAPVKTHLGRQSFPKPPDFTLPDPDPGEGFKDTNHQLFQYYNVALEYPPEPTNMGFVNNYASAMLYGTYGFGDAPTDPREIMTCYTPKQVPVLSKLAREFAVCDRWFCSVPSQTLPNRDFIHAATSTGYVNNGPNSLCDAKTIFNQIQEAIDGKKKDLSWGIFGNNPYSTKPSDEAGNFGKEHFSLTRVIMKQLHDPRFDQNFGTLDEFKEKCQKRELPSYSFLEPNFHGPSQNDQHPPSDIRAGEQLIADIYNAVKDSPAFAETLLVITYDEHGGCYDHYPPPNDAKNPDPNNKPGQGGFLFNRFGVRVPTVLISPYIEAGTVARPDGWPPFDHTSVIATVQNCFGLQGHLTARDAVAPDLSCVLTLDEPRQDAPVVEPLPYENQDTNDVNALHRVIADVLTELTGQPRPDGKDLFEFISESYLKVFGTGK
jgi:phospholipase C